MINNLPTSFPSLNLDFINTRTLDPRITFTRNSVATRFNSAGILEVVENNQPRFDYDPITLQSKGLLIEESRTNSIRNNTMQGVVTGTPGTIPTNWSLSESGGGITRQIVGTGIEDGINYVDVRYYGTPTSGVASIINFEQVNSIPAANTQTWTTSVFVKLIAGSFANTTTILSQLPTDGVTGVQSFETSAITSTPGSLKNCKISVSGTITNANTTHISTRVRIGYTLNNAFDITLRIGMPQLERGAFPTSVIPTSVAAVTRDAENASIDNINPWYNPIEGTLFSEFDITGYTKTLASTFAAIVRFDNNSSPTFSDRFGVSATNSGADPTKLYVYSAVRSNDVEVAGFYNYTNSGQFTENMVLKTVLAVKNNDFAFRQNQLTTQTDTGGNMPTSQTRFLLGTSTAHWLNGHLRRVSYYPTRLPNAQFQELTK